MSVGFLKYLRKLKFGMNFEKFQNNRHNFFYFKMTIIKFSCKVSKIIKLFKNNNKSHNQWNQYLRETTSFCDTDYKIRILKI